MSALTKKCKANIPSTSNLEHILFLHPLPKGTLGYLEKFFKGYALMQICSKLPIEKMFALYFFCQSTHCPDTIGGQICPPPV